MMTPYEIEDITEDTWVRFEKESPSASGVYSADLRLAKSPSTRVPDPQEMKCLGAKLGRTSAVPSSWKLNLDEKNKRCSYTQDPLTLGKSTSLELTFLKDTAEAHSEIKIFRVKDWEKRKNSKGVDLLSEPAFFVVTIPDQLEIDANNRFPRSLPFVVYFLHTAENDPDLKSKDRLSQEWLFKYAWRPLNALEAEVGVKSPFLKDNDLFMGLPFQINRVQNQVDIPDHRLGKGLLLQPKAFVLVHFPMPFVAPGVDLWRFHYADELERVLLGIQAKILECRAPRGYTPPLPLKWVALATRSDGCERLERFLGNNNKPTATADQKRFLREVVKEVFVFDPGTKDSSQSDRVVTNGKQWFDMNSFHYAKAFRFYTRSYNSKVMEMLGKPVVGEKEAGYFESTVRNTTTGQPENKSLAFLPGSSGVWKRSGMVGDVHQLIPKLMLTHALLKSQLRFKRVGKYLAPAYEAVKA
jgi:hypothetical protein